MVSCGGQKFGEGGYTHSAFNGGLPIQYADTIYYTTNANERSVENYY